MNESHKGTSSINKSSPTTKSMACEEVAKSDHTFLLLFYSLLFIVGLILNSFTLWFHCHGPHKQVSKSWMIFLKHLTIADLLLCFSLPVRIMHHASSSFTISLLSRSVGTSVLYLNMFASILFMGFIAANRYMKIFHSLETNFLMTTKASHIISVTVWFVLLAIATSYTILMLMTYEATQYHRTCEHFMNKRVKTLYLAIHTFATISFLSVLFSLIFFYCKTFHRLRKIQQRQLGSSSTKLVKSCRIMSVLVIAFCICFVPYHVVRFLYVLLQGHCSQVFYYIKETAVLISVCNICLDPVIYVFLCKDFRTKFNLKELFCTKRHN